jgi:hypothetical protein
MQALIIAGADELSVADDRAEIVAHEAYKYASAMLAARACWGNQLAGFPKGRGNRWSE